MNNCLEIPTFETSDFYLSCYLKCVGYDLIDVRKNGHKVTFVFTDQPMRRDTLLAFYNREGSVKPLEMVDTIRDMKALIYNV